MKKLLLAAAAVAVAGPALAQTPPAAPAAPAAQAAPASPQVPRHPGAITAGTAETATYASACPAFVFGLTAEEAQEAETAAAIASVRERYNSARERFSDYQDCVVENAAQDIGALSENMNKSIETMLRAANQQIATDAQAVVAALQERGTKPFPPPPRQRRGDPPPAPPEPPAPPAEAPPLGRMMGAFSAGPLQTAAYSTACPMVTLEWTVQRAGEIKTREEFTAAADYINGLSDTLNRSNDCVIENANEDLKLLAARVEKQVGDKLQAEAGKLNEELRAIQFYLNAKVAPTPPRPAARPPRRN